jgi:hypothetical protein
MFPAWYSMMKTSVNAPYPADVALAFATGNESITAASFAPDGSIATAEFLLDESLYPALNNWRLSLGQHTDLRTVFRFVPTLFTEETRVAALPDEALTLPDEALTRWLVEAALTQTAGEDGFPLFEAALDNTAYDYARLPDGQVSLTELPRDLLHDARKRVLQTKPLETRDLASLTDYAPDDSQPFLLHAVETRLRAVTRFLAVRDADFFNALGAQENVAVFAFTPLGCGFALWNPAQGFHTECGECFDLNYNETDVPPDVEPADYVAQLYLDGATAFLQEQFYRRIVPEDGVAPAFPGTRLYWTATAGLDAPLSELLRE